MRKEKKSKKLLSTLLSISMLSTLAVFPLSAEAATSATADGIVTSNGVSLNYNKHLRDNGDGTYTLTFAAKTSISHMAMNTDIYTAEDGVYTVPEDGDYIIQAWGSKGGKGSDVNTAIIGTNMKNGGQGGAAGYVEGTFRLTKGQKIAYTIGSNGSTTATNGAGSGVNGDGGSHGGSGSYGVGGGGGYTAVFVYDADEPVTYSHDGNYVLIAGGGGGGGAGHNSQTYTPNGGDAGNMKTSASAKLDSKQNNVPGTYYAGSDGHSNSDNDEYVGKGATNVPGASETSIWGWIASGSGNDWLGTYNADKDGGAGGDGNGRGGAGGAGFAGGSGGVQQVFNIAWNCGGGGGGSSFIADGAEAVDEKFNDYILSENVSTTGGCVAIVRALENLDNIQTLQNASLSGTIGDEFEIIDSAENINVNGDTFTIGDVSLVPATLSSAQPVSDSKEFSFNITLKPKEGFAGGNNVPLLKGVTISNSNYTFEIDTKTQNANTDFVNVPWGKKVTANTIYAEPGSTVTTKDLYVDDNGRSEIDTANYKYIKFISDYTVDEITTDTFTAPEQTTRYTVSYTVEATDNPAKVGTPADGTYSAEAVVDVSGMEYVDVDGSHNGYKKKLKYNNDGTYDLVIEHNIGVADTAPAEEIYTDEITEVGTYTTAGEYTHNIAEDGYYLILLRGADGGDGGDTCSELVAQVGSIGGGHRHGYGGAGADGGYAYFLEHFSKEDVLNLSIGKKGTNADYNFSGSSLSKKRSAKAGTAGTGTAVSFDGNYLAIASGGAGGGGAYSYNSLGSGDDMYSHGYAAMQGVTKITSLMPTQLPESSNGTNGSDEGASVNSWNMVFKSGESADSYIYEINSVEAFDFRNKDYDGIKNSEAFKNIINIETIPALTDRDHKCQDTTANGITPAPHVFKWTSENEERDITGVLRQEHKELTEMNGVAGVKIYKITRERNQTGFDRYTSNLNLSGTISKYFDIKGVTVTGAKDGYNATYANGGDNNTSTFSVTGITQSDADTNIVYTIKLTPKAGFLGGNDVPVLNNAEFTRSSLTEDTTDDTGVINAKDESDFANVAIAGFDFGLETEDKTIVKGNSVNVSDLVKNVNEVADDWKADYVTAKTTLDGTDGATSVSPVVTTEYTLTAELAPKTESVKAVVANEAESCKQSKPVTVYVEYSVTYDVTNITPSNTDNAKYHESYSTTLQSNGYALPETITVTMGDSTLAQGTDYTYNRTTGHVNINANVIDDNIVISARATEKEYTITYVAHAKDGTVADTHEDKYTIGATVSTTWADGYKENADKSAEDGYAYKWIWDTADGNAPETMPGTNLTVNGYYDKKMYNLTVNYQYEGGAKAAESYSQDYYWGDEYIVNSPEIDGFIANPATVSGTMPKENVTVTVTYKQKEADKHTLTIYYVYDNEDGAPAADTYAAQIAENDGYEVTSPVIDGYKTDKTVVSGTMGTTDVTVYVIYVEDVTPVTVTFDPQGGTLAVGAETKTVYYGNNKTYGSLPTPVKSDGKFLGWFTEATGGTQVTSSTVVTNAEAHTLYAHWEALTDAVTYNANGGKFSDSETIKTVTGTYGEAYPTVEDPKRDGYEFTGWYTNAEATNAFTVAGATFVYSSPRTLYAGWKTSDSAKVVFKENNIAVKSYDMEIGGTLTETIYQPSKNGGYFKGWFADKANGTYKSPLTIDYFEKKQGRNSFTVTDNTGANEAFLLEYLANWYSTDGMGDTKISDAKAQAVKLANGNEYIRFLALIDKSYGSYDKAGFVISTECLNPTVQSGYQYSTQTEIYKKIKAMSKENGEAVWLDIAYLEQSEFGFKDGAGLLYTNLKVSEANKDKTYYCTPYIIEGGNYVYGETKAISYNELKKKDQAVTDKNGN